MRGCANSKPGVPGGVEPNIVIHSHVTKLLIPAGKTGVAGVLSAVKSHKPLYNGTGLELIRLESPRAMPAVFEPCPE